VNVADNVGVTEADRVGVIEGDRDEDEVTVWDGVNVGDDVGVAE
jgi:hypothetical protein